ncbi:MAG: hypothetical protein HY706_15545 [Candidatus Hydrogenedentes bacterium]|nr:hypothetical protein [Candidatus Hydrogenedentota bacterium]
MAQHPSKPELLAYTENLVRGAKPVSAMIAGHIANCKACAGEMRAMRKTLAVIRLVPGLEPTQESTSQVFAVVRQERRRLQWNQRRAWFNLAKGLSYAAALILMSTVYFGAMVNTEAGEVSASRIAPAAAEPQADLATLEELRQATEEIQTLAAAVSVPSSRPASLWEREYRRAALTLDAEIADALAALERNPGCSRASYLVNSNVQRQRQTLRAWYVERSL